MTNRQAERNLARSRNRFFHEEDLPHENFWFSWHSRLDPKPPVSDQDLAALQNWSPERSNCPELTGVVEDLIQDMPHEWRSLASELFVGRIFHGEVQATAETIQRGRIVRLALQYTNVLSAYVTAWDEQGAALRLLLDAVQTGGSDVEERIAELDRSRFARYWELLEEGGSDWRDPAQIAGLAADLRAVSSPDRSDARAYAVLQAERWIVSHEIAHHLLGHTVRQNKRLPAAEMIAQFRNPSEISTLNPRQALEYDADLLAHLLLSGACRPDAALTRHDLYRAETGSVMALVSMTHVTGHWVTSNRIGETHPGLDIRFQLLSDVIDRLSVDMSVGSQGDHPQDLLIDLRLFVAAAYDAARRQAGAGSDRRLTLLELANESLKRKEELRDALATRRTPPPS